jgi:hypothetical protein
MAVILLVISIGMVKSPSLGWLLLVIISVYGILFAPEKDHKAGNYVTCNVRRK